MDSELKQYLDQFSERTDAQFRQMREENASAHEETRRVLREEMADMAGGLRGEMADMAGGLRGEMADMAGTLRGEMGKMATGLRGEMTTQIGAAVSTLRGEIAAENAETRRYVDERIAAESAETRRYVDQRMAGEHAETRRHFDITVERWETRFDLLAESVQMVDEKLDRNVTEIRQEIATIKFTRTRRAKR
jgi:hypothetical protein